MKKLIVLSVIFALVASAAFAVDLSGTVFGHVNVIQGSTEKDSDVGSSGNMDRQRLEGSGEVADGAFGGAMRLDNGNIAHTYAWWKPIDQFKLIIGSHADGFWGKEGVTGWGLNQMPYDSGVALNPGIWYWNGGGSSIFSQAAAMHSRYTFFGGWGDDSAMLEITPIDMLSINIGIPFFAGGKAEDVFKKIVAQVNVNLDFGNIAITYRGGRGYDKGKTTTSTAVIGAWIDSAGALQTGAPPAGTTGATIIREDKPAAPVTTGDYNDPSTIFAYFGGTFGDLGIDVGFSARFGGNDDAKDPIGIGLGVKYAVDSFGVKFRLTAALGGDDKTTYINTSVVPYYAINDNLTVFLNAGLGVTAVDVSGVDPVIGFYVNPYLRVGAEWGPSFYAGFQLWSDGVETAGEKITKWAVPVALMVSF